MIFQLTNGPKYKLSRANSFKNKKAMTKIKISKQRFPNLNVGMKHQNTKYFITSRAN